MTNHLRYQTIIFDWGDTIIYDHPERAAPVIEWETIELIEGIVDVLAYLHTSRRRILLATSANVSDERQIRGALARCDINQYFSHIYCFKNTNLSKGEAFYRHILSDLNIPASDALMVGDHVEKDVHIPNSLGMFAIWFNSASNETRKSKLHVTVHSMDELRKFFESLN